MRQDDSGYNPLYLPRSRINTQNNNTRKTNDKGHNNAETQCIARSSEHREDLDGSLNPNKNAPNVITTKDIYRMVMDFAIWALLPTPPSRDAEALVPGLRSKIFQNFRLSSAAEDTLADEHNNTGISGTYEYIPAVASIWPSGLRQLCRTRVSWAGISTLRTRVG